PPPAGSGVKDSATGPSDEGKCGYQGARSHPVRQMCRFVSALPVIEGMRRPYKNLCVAALLPIAAYALGASAQSGGGPYRIAPAAVANGGGVLGAGAFELRGTLGQATASTLSAAGYHLYGGFWAPASDAIFANGFDK
ncbi:MAG TPA: hypothetical protein VLB69_07760, partial [Rudaea sp.]|nr:hypothetical protein [Rudaea sp.]